MIGLTIERYIGPNPFFEYPEFHQIWPEKLALIAEQGVIEHLAIQHTHDIGAVYLIKVGDRPIGITGYFPYHGFKPIGSHCDTKDYGLRWHGIVQGYRGYAYSFQALSLVAQEIEKANPQAEWLIELVPQDEFAERATKYFTEIGFRPFGARERYEWYPHEWQPHRINVKWLAKFHVPSANAGVRFNFQDNPRNGR